MLPLFQIIFFFFFLLFKRGGVWLLKIFRRIFSAAASREARSPQTKKVHWPWMYLFFIYKFTINERASYKGTCWLNLIGFSPNTNRLRTRCEYRLPSLDPQNFRRPAGRKSQAAESKRISVASKCAFWNRRFDAGVLRARAIPRYF